MPGRGSTETIVAIFRAFLQQREWPQAHLAKHIGITVEGLRKRLFDLKSTEMPLSFRSEHPHVIWSVPKNWLPGGLVLDANDTISLMRLILRAPKSTERSQWIRKIVSSAAPKDAQLHIPENALVSDEEPSKLATIEESLLRKKVLYMRYHSRSRPDPEWRYVSVQFIDSSPPARFVALCHRSAELRVFRADRVYSAQLVDAHWWRESPEKDVRELIEESLHWFHEGPATDYVFFVRSPESYWVRNNLPIRGKIEDKPNGEIKITIRTGAPSILARYVVGLGEAVRIDTPDLRDRVIKLARGILSTHHST